MGVMVRGLQTLPHSVLFVDYFVVLILVCFSLLHVMCHFPYFYLHILMALFSASNSWGTYALRGYGVKEFKLQFGRNLLSILMTS